MKHTTYKEQAQEIERIAKEIISKANKFAEKQDSPWYGDLNHIIDELKETSSFLQITS